MAKLEISVRHKLTQKDALLRIKKFLGELKRAYARDISELQEKWHNDRGVVSFKVRGIRVAGELTVKEKEVVLEGDIPLMALPFKKRIIEMVKHHMRDLLA